MLTNLLLGLTLGSAVGSLLLSGLALLEKGLRDQDLVLGRDATVENVLVGPQGACHEGSLAPSEELRRSGLALMHSPLSTGVCLCATNGRRRLCWVSSSTSVPSLTASHSDEPFLTSRRTEARSAGFQAFFALSGPTASQFLTRRGSGQDGVRHTS